MIGKSKEPQRLPPEELMVRLARRGPHKVLAGDLGFVGVPGRLFTPDAGSGLPLVAFAHAWMADAGRYRDLLFHLASHGIVVAAPDIERGFAPSDAALAAGLRTALTGLAAVRLGLTESVTVDPQRCGLAGHGFGASAAVLAAGTDVLESTEPIAVEALAAVFPAPSTDVAVAAAAAVTAPAMVLAADTALDTVDANPLPLARGLGGPVTLRSVPGATDRGLLQRRTLRSLIGINGADRATHAAVRALLTGFFLATVSGNDRYAAFTDPEAVLGEVLTIDPAEPDADDRTHLEKLMGGPPAAKRGTRSSIRALRGG